MPRFSRTGLFCGGGFFCARYSLLYFSIAAPLETAFFLLAAYGFFAARPFLNAGRRTRPGAERRFGGGRIQTLDRRGAPG
ncbi:MAG: hypothetical protein DBX55_01290 [Verrucomicrobia bacterium]|nr:MAG: hypothetical protein DBX55_01290 [Verrucomicrobiota bacterium]